ncbi:RHTO0S09e01244g1_1 [Rhodotorula toruloides]|uniref:RHTO0S09e01244g1_1 n=2 Tax=Rhodotorula toruloides TaxID=5286 RepID=A0A061BB93_RHOTO|nr:uncharacterized protein RHTO_07875 [Rhodotorula toruloides NP11]EMS23004.1 hypothetical protein RHTO_07875 [Rhodotorula toruloides NP11]CDR44211.1 RHTO0S09e01244g1_1 [Rhodotorula toruloides]
MQPPPSAEGERIDPETLLKLLWKVAQDTPEEYKIKIKLTEVVKEKKAGADANSKGIALPESKSDGDPLVAFELDVTAEEFLKNYAHLKRPLDIEVSGDWKVVSSDGIILALHLTNILGFLLNDSSKGLEEAERMGAWIEREILANGGAPRAATKSRHASYLRKPDPRKGATHLFAWAPAGHEEPAQIRASKDMSAEYVSRLGENISIAIEAVIKTLSIIENAAYQVLVKNWNEKLAGSSFAVKMNNPFWRHQGLVIVHNLPADPHIDILDSKIVMTAMLPTGDFEGGQLTLESIGIKSEYRPGDVVFVRSWLVKHAVLAISDGDTRHSLVFVLQDKLATKGGFEADWQGLATGEAAFGSSTNEEEARRKGDAEALKVRREREMEQEMAEAGRRGKGKGHASADDVARWEEERRPVPEREEDNGRMWVDSPF